MNTKRITTELAEAADFLRDGQLVAVPTETVYGLAGNGLDVAAVEQIYEVKGRPAVKPLSLMVPGMESIDRVCSDVPPAAYALAERFWPDVSYADQLKEAQKRAVDGGLGVSYLWRES